MGSVISLEKSKRVISSRSAHRAATIVLALLLLHSALPACAQQISVPSASASNPFSSLQGPRPLIEISTGALQDVLQDPSPKVAFDHLPQQPRSTSAGLGALFPLRDGVEIETAFGGRLALSPPGAAETTGKLPAPELTGFGLALKLAAGKQWQVSLGYRREQSAYANDAAAQMSASGPLQDTLFFGIWHAF